MRISKRGAHSTPEKSERQHSGRWVVVDLIALTLITTTVTILVIIGNASAVILAAASGFIVAVYEVWRRNRV